jgi:uncharacterized protein YegP (UPF0339 family)
MMEKVNVYKDAAGEFRWQRTAQNGNIVATSGEGYKNANDCIEMATKLNKTASIFFMGQPVVELNR